MATITAFIKKLDDLGSVQFAELKQEIANGGMQLIERGFQTETDPYGARWKFVKEHEGHQSILWDSGRLKSGWSGVPFVNGVRFVNNVPYANRQNYTRQMIPSSQRGLPPAWKSMITRAFNKIMTRALKENL